MVTTWLPGVDYQENEIVQLHAARFRATKAHRSQGDSQPPLQPWEECTAEAGIQPKRTEYSRSFDHIKKEVHISAKPLGHKYYKPETHQQGNPEEEHKSDTKRSQFFQKLGDKFGSNPKLAEGIMAAGKLVGAEVELKHSLEFKPFLSEELWLSDAKLRAEHYKKLVEASQPVPSVEWFLVEDGAIPPNAIPCGHEKHGQRQYACRAYIKNGVHCGKYVEGDKAFIGHGAKEVSPAVVEILVGYPADVLWLDCDESLGNCNGMYKGHRLVIGGNDGDKPFYVGQSHHEKGVHLGKASDRMLLPFNGKEVHKKSFRVLAYA